MANKKASKNVLLKLSILITVFTFASCAAKKKEPTEEDSSTKIVPKALVKVWKKLEDFRPFVKNAALLHTDISNLERIKVISNFPVAKIRSAPGHLALRKPEAVKSMAKSIEAAADGGKSFVKGQDKIVLNVFTEKVVSESGQSEVVIKSVEVMDGNHRLAAGLHAKKMFGRPVWGNIGDIPEEVLEVRVNGELAHGGGRPRRWIPWKIFAGQSCNSHPPCWQYREGRRGHFLKIKDDRGGDSVEVDGDLSSLDERIPDKYKGRTMREVLDCSLKSSCSQ